jgi:hypothetical protein
MSQSYTIKKNKNTSNQRKTKKYIDFYCNINEIDFKIIKILSESKDSASKANVYLVKGRNDNKNYVIKNVEINSEYSNYQKLCLFNEIEMYKIMNLLSLKNVSPHIITNYTNYLCNPNLIPQKNKNKKKNKTKLKQNKYYIFQINESQNDDQHCITLESFIEEYIEEKTRNTENIYTDEVLLNILFQILYTLYIFTKIKLNHNDLHLGNILIYIDNVLPTEIKTNKYIFGNKGKEDSIYLRYLGYSVRIFDFDRSFKNSLTGKETTPFYLFNKEIKTPLYAEKNNTKSNNINEMFSSNKFDDNRDVYKIISHIIDLLVGNKSPTTILPVLPILPILPILLSTKRNDYYDKYIYSNSTKNFNSKTLKTTKTYKDFKIEDEDTFILFNDLIFFTEGWYIPQNYDDLIKKDNYNNLYLYIDKTNDIKKYVCKYIQDGYKNLNEYHFISNPIDKDANFKSTYEIVKLFANILKREYQYYNKDNNNGNNEDKDNNGNNKDNVINTYDYSNVINTYDYRNLYKKSEESEA